MAQVVTIVVTAATNDVDRLCKRLEMLSDVEEAKEMEAEDGGTLGADLLVTCPGSVRNSDVEELLKGIEGVEVELLK